MVCLWCRVSILICSGYCCMYVHRSYKVDLVVCTYAAVYIAAADIQIQNSLQPSQVVVIGGYPLVIASQSHV